MVSEPVTEELVRTANLKDNFEPGMDLTSPVTIIGEGPRGHLARKVIQRRQLDANSQPMVYELGCKEVLELPEGTVKDGYCLHSLGYPLNSKAFGGSFLHDGRRQGVHWITGSARRKESKPRRST